MNYLIGGNHDEGMFLFSRWAKSQGHDLTQMSAETAREYFRIVVQQRWEDEDVTSLVEACWGEYMRGREESSEGRVRAVVELMGDLYFWLSTLSMAALHAGQAFQTHYLMHHDFDSMGEICCAK